MSDTYAGNKPKNMLLIDATLCIGCASCQAACQMEHDLPACSRTVRVLQLGPFEEDDSLTMSFVPTTCFHCERPACVAECPTGAMQKRDDGIVFSDPEICIGCRTCAVACPYGIPELNLDTGKIAKCDGCKDRTDRGLWPACALKCPTEALTFGSAPMVVQDRRQKEALKLARAF
jgi:Fe-S-cluster-containing dehydrogenase component